VGVDPYSIAAKIVPLTLHKLAEYRRSNVSRSLDRRVRDEFDADPSLGPQSTEALQWQWIQIHNDERAAALISALLRTGNLTYLQALRIRITEMLDGLETLPMGVEVAVARIVEAVEHNFVAAQKDEMNAAQATTSSILSVVGELPTRHDLSQGIDQLRRDLTPPPARVVVLASSFAADQRRHVEELVEQDEIGASQLIDVLKTGGAMRLAEVVRSPPAWTSDRRSSFWRAAGRILFDAGLFDAAARAFLTESELPDADRARALIDAALSLETERDDGTNAGEPHFKAAEAIDAQHPLVALFRASRLADPHRRLADTDAVQPRNDREISRKETQRALALLALGEFDDALTAARRSAAAHAHGPGNEIAALATILAARELLPSQSRDERPLMNAVAYLLSLHAEALEAGRSVMAGLVGARAALGSAVLGDWPAALELLDQISSDANMRSLGQTRALCVETAMTAGAPERAREFFAPLDDSPESRLDHAGLALATGDDRSGAVTALDELLTELSPGDLRDRAVTMRLAAARNPDVEFDPSLASELENPERRIAEVQAVRALRSGKPAEARAAISAFDDLASLQLRIKIAEMEGAIPEASGLQRVIVRRDPSGSNLLRLAQLRALAGDTSGAINDALRLATDDRKFLRTREYAYAVAAKAAMESGEYEELEDIAERWAELSPGEDDPLWIRVLALARQGRHGEALVFGQQHDLQPAVEGDRHLLWAEVLLYGSASGAAKMRAVMELSDRLGRPDGLERAFISAVMTTPAAERGEEDPEVVARFQAAFEASVDRSPESVTKIKFDEDDPDAFFESLREAAPPPSPAQAHALDNLLSGVRQGRTPIAFLAGHVGRGTIDVLVHNQAHPLAVFDRRIAEAESAAAEHALDRAAASWDETAIATVAQLPSDTARRIETLIPGSFVGQSVRNSLAEAVKTRLGGEQVGRIQFLPDGAPQIVAEEPATIARIRELENKAESVANKLQASSDRPDGGDEQLRELVDRFEHRGPMAALASALLASKVRSVPLYSDDRVLRAYARVLGIPAFGTIALIDAVARRGVITGDEAVAILQSILDLGVWSTALDPEIYVNVARRADFDLARCGRALLADEALLHVDHRFVHNALLLAVIAHENPDRADEWASAIVHSYEELLQIAPLVSASVLITVGLDPSATAISEDDRAANVRVIQSLRTAVRTDRSQAETDPLIAAIVNQTRSIEDESERATVIENLLMQIDAADEAVVRAIFD
jgi:tetratricopeptide (TPR) repeat protein